MSSKEGGAGHSMVTNKENNGNDNLKEPNNGNKQFAVHVT